METLSYLFEQETDLCNISSPYAMLPQFDLSWISILVGMKSKQIAACNFQFEDNM